MRKTNKITSEQRYVFFFSKYSAQILFIVFFLLSAEFFAQEETKTRNFSIHAGLNSGILEGGSGPSFSLNYASRTQKVLQLESTLFFDQHAGEEFLGSNTLENWVFGLAAGLRINVLPRKNWNPSFFLMLGTAYSSEISSIRPESKGISAAISVGFSINLYQRHMITIGYNGAENIQSILLKYGFSF